MRIATWNINGLRARLELVKRWLIERQPDVVGFQELKTLTEEFPHDAFLEIGYHALVHGEKAWNGVAILTRAPAELVQTGLPGETGFGSRLLTARIQDLEFTTVYCPNGKTLDHADYQRKLAWFESLTTHWQHLERSAAAVLCGDFNIVQPLWTVGRARRPTARSFTPWLSVNASAPSWVPDSPICSVTTHPTNRPIPGGITAAVHSTNARVCALI